MLGLFGAHSSDPDDVETILGRLAQSRQQSIVRYPADRSASGEDGLAPVGSLTTRGTALLSGPYLADGNSSPAGAGSGSSVIAAFAGHLTSPVEGIEGPAENPAEIVRRAYRKWGTGCFTRLNGNFAVAIFDPGLPGFILARDSGGTKPLFYSLGDCFVFGSSASEVLRASGIPAAANPHALLRYLAIGAVGGETETLFQGVCAVPGSHFLEVVPGGAPKVCPIPCGIHTGPRDAPASLDQASEELRCLLLETIKAQSSGKQTGVAVSGGIDSSGVIAGLREAVDPSQPLHAFCYVHGHPAMPEAWNELPWAERMAKCVRATLHTVKLEASAIPGAMSEIFPRQDFPFSSPVILVQGEVFRVAADHGMEVMLSGHGPDFILGGGSPHIFVRGSSLLRQGRLLALWSYLHGAASYAELPPGRLLLLSLRQAVPIAPRRNRFPAALPWVRRSWFLDRAAVREEEPLFRSSDPMRQLILDQLYRHPLPSGLHFEECNALLNGLENRLPYLVASTLRLAGRLPADYLVSDLGETRRVLRRALRGLVPDPILDRPHPVGFAAPLVPWLHELRPWVEECMRELRSLPFYQEAPASTLWPRLQGLSPAEVATAYCAWRWIALLEWAKAYNIKFQ